MKSLWLIVLSLIVAVPGLAFANEGPPPTEILNLVIVDQHVCVFLGISGDYCEEDFSGGDPHFEFDLDRNAGDKTTAMFSDRRFWQKDAVAEDPPYSYYFVFAIADSCVPAGTLEYTFSSDTVQLTFDTDTLKSPGSGTDCQPVDDSFCFSVDYSGGGQVDGDNDDAGNNEDNDSGGCSLGPGTVALPQTLLMLLIGLLAGVVGWGRRK